MMTLHRQTERAQCSAYICPRTPRGRDYDRVLLRAEKGLVSFPWAERDIEFHAPINRRWKTKASSNEEPEHGVLTEEGVLAPLCSPTTAVIRGSEFAGAAAVKGAGPR